jgi:GcrA cell cycle regulator
MSWTDERVSRLAKLWAEGLSASQVAADLGGVTRNAVIGKVHRLGLSGRAKPAGKSNAGSRRKTASGAAGANSGGSGGGGGNYTRTRQTTRTVGNTVIKLDVEEEVAFRPKPVPDPVLPVSRELTLMQLSESTCKWPTGDPTMPGFSFCGHSVADDKPYCGFHNKLAFQPANERRRRR